MAYKRSLRMSDDARGGWERAKRETGCSVSALVEALGLMLADGKHPLTPEVIELARQIDLERAKRR